MGDSAKSFRKDNYMQIALFVNTHQRPASDLRELLLISSSVWSGRGEIAIDESPNSDTQNQTNALAGHDRYVLHRSVLEVWNDGILQRVNQCRKLLPNVIIELITTC